jgi:putative cell wall-binding protein
MTRYTTAIEVSKGVFPDCSCDTVVLATGTSFPDALSASGLAGAYECPLLLVGSQLDEVITELNRLNASTVVIVGGTGAVSQDIEDVLDDTFTVDRIQGVNRYETSALVAERIEDLVGADVAFIVRGDNFADALAVSPFAYSQRMPVLLTASTALSGRTATALSDLDIEEAVIAGGEGAVVPGVKTTVDSILVANGGSESSRWWGADRYATARDVAEKGILAGWGTPGVVGLATGTNFPDALGGGAACGYHGGVLLLTTPSSLSSQAEGFLSANSGFVGEVRLSGGTGALADQVMTDAGVAIY